MYNCDEVTDVNDHKDLCKDPDIISDNQLGHAQVAHFSENVSIQHLTSDV